MRPSGYLVGLVVVVGGSALLCQCGDEPEAVNDDGGSGTSIPPLAFTDAAGDMFERPPEAAPPNYAFVDITGVEFTSSANQRQWRLRVRNMPPTLTFNGADIDLAELEYEWGVEIDLEEDGQVDYSVVASYRKQSYGAVTASVIDQVPVEVRQHTGLVWDPVGAGTLAMEEWSTLVFTVDAAEVPALQGVSGQDLMVFKTYYDDGTRVLADRALGRVVSNQGRAPTVANLFLNPEGSSPVVVVSTFNFADEDQDVLWVNLELTAPDDSVTTDSLPLFEINKYPRGLAAFGFVVEGAQSGTYDVGLTVTDERGNVSNELTDQFQIP